MVRGGMVVAAAVVTAFLSSAPATAAPVLVSTGDLGINVINDAGNYQWEPVLDSPTGAGPDTLTVKYGLFNSPQVPVDVRVNGVLVSSFLADVGYVNPGPEFAQVDVTGRLVPGPNTILFTGNSVNSGDYVIGQVDLLYDSNSSVPVPEPATLVLLGVGILRLAHLRRRPD